MELNDYRIECGWSQNEMARKAGIDFSTLHRALNGEAITIRTASAIANAISMKLGRKVQFQDIEKLNVNL